MALFVIFSFLLGLAVGSFLNVVIIRGARDEKISGRSRCESCGKTLAWYELIPLVSFALQKGRCRTCGAALSWQYPLVEFVTGVLFAFTVWYFLGGALFALLFWPYPFSVRLYPFGSTLLAWIVLSAAIVIFVSDLRSRIIPNGAVLTTLLSGTAIRLLPWVPGISNSSFVTRHSSLLWDFGAAIAIALFFAAIWFSTKGRGMGFGDVKLVLATSVVLGFPQSVVAALLAFWIGAAAGILLILFRLKSWKDQIPFGPYILIGAALAFFFSDQLLLLLGF